MFLVFPLSEQDSRVVSNGSVYRKYKSTFRYNPHRRSFRYAGERRPESKLESKLIKFHKIRRRTLLTMVNFHILRKKD